VGSRNQKKRKRLFASQDGKCYWCDCQMILVEKTGNRKEFFDDEATLEHLDSRLSNQRGKSSGRRVVLACRLCNHKRGVEEESLLPIEELHRRSSKSKRPK